MKIAIAFLLCAVPVAANAQVCRTCVPTVRSQKVIVQEQAVPQVFVINNVPAVPQGSVTYSSVYPQISLIDVNALAAQALQLQQSAVEAQASYHDETLEFLEDLVEIQRPIAEILAKGQAAAEVLNQAGLGRSDVEGSTEAAAPSLAQQHCGKCHTGSKAKAGFRMDREFDAAKAVAMVAGGKMPPDSKIADAERLLLIGELLASATASE